MHNREIGKIINEIGQYLEMKGIPFKPRAFNRAATTIFSLDTDLEKIYKDGGINALVKLPNIGKGVGEKIEELIKTGKCSDYEKLKKEVPVNLSELTAIEGVGIKVVKQLYSELKIKTLDDLEKAAKQKNVRKLEGLGEKSEQNILKSISFLKKSGGRHILGFTMPIIRDLEARLGSLESVKKIVIAGSTRRRKETIGDIDVLVASSRPNEVADYFVSMAEVAHVYAHGKTKFSVRLASNIDVDLRIIKEASFGAALNYFTGSKQHNVALRELAQKRGWKLNEYGLFKGGRQIAVETEKELYNKLGLDYIEPEMREMTGELQLSKKRSLPKLIEYNDLKGDLQIQTSWSDGKNTIEEMVKAAQEKRLSYIAITDHTKRLTIANGLDEKRLLRQIKKIDSIQKKLGTKFKILKGTECDILKNGELDINDDVLSKLDVVGISVHAHFKLSKKEQTQRIIRAMENPHADILFHPIGRIINRREAYEVDMSAIIKTAKRTGTILEIDAFPDRLDIHDKTIKKCVEEGVKMSISSDAHATAHYDYLEYGIAQARRGWAEKKDIINTRSWDKMLKLLK